MDLEECSRAELGKRAPHAAQRPLSPFHSSIAFLSPFLQSHFRQRPGTPHFLITFLPLSETQLQGKESPVGHQGCPNALILRNGARIELRGTPQVSLNHKRISQFSGWAQTGQQRQGESGSSAHLPHSVAWFQPTQEESWCLPALRTSVWLLPPSQACRPNLLLPVNGPRSLQCRAQN